MPLSNGTHLGSFEILAPIGAGGMGEVYKARDTRLDRTVAIKILPEHLADKPQLRERFEREARAVSSLNHPHICTLHDVGQQDGVDYLVMEYLEGETLAHRLDKGPLPLDQALRYAIEIAAALDHAHRHGVVHRDLKPGNIMLTRTGAKVLDFGLAKIGAGLKPVPLATMTLTEEGVILGTLQYMAPEQLEGKEADARTDIFAFGAVVYEMATGIKAFEGKSRASVMAAILERQPPPIASLQSLTPPALDHVVRTCMAKDPEARRQTAHDVMLELQWIAEGGSQAGVPAPVVAHRKNRERVAWGLVGIAVAAAITLGFVAFLRPPPDARLMRFLIQAPEGAVLADDQTTGGSAISPDGRLLALVASSTTGTSSQRLLWIRALDSLAAQPLSGTEGAKFPFWSPDSRFIGFFAQGSLKKIDVAGRSVQTICDAQSGTGTSAWNKEGVILFSLGGPLHRVPAAGGAPAPTTVLDASRKETNHRYVQFLPDGHHFLYTAFTEKAHSEDHALYVASLDSGKLSVSGPRDRKRLVSTDYKGGYAPSAHGGSGHLLFWRGNSLMAQPFDPQKLELAGEPVPVADQGGEPDNGTASRPFSISENGVLAYPSNLPFENSQMVWYDRAGKRLGTVGEPGRYHDPRLSPDQRQLAVELHAKDSYNSSLWLFDLIRNTASRFTFHPAGSILPIWSPDGSRIAFNSNWEGTNNFYQKFASGMGSEEQILKSTLTAIPFDWSRDGHFIVYVEINNDKGAIWVLPLEGDRKPFPFGQTEFSEGAPALSPDGRWMAYSSNESGKNEVYTRTFTGKPGATASAGKWLISTSGGNSPRWRRDGRELFYQVNGKVMAVETKSGAKFEAGAPKLLFDTHAQNTWYDVAADGQRFVIVMPVDQARVRSPITVVLNWQAALKK